jgi:CheY-like chemotaxis protein
MALELEILGPNDRPALLGIESADVLDYAIGVLEQMGYKVRSAISGEEFVERFGRVQYELIIIQDTFGMTDGENVALKTLQNMPMSLRRHATVVLLSENLPTLEPMPAFQQSVHAVVNRVDVDKLMLILQQVVNDNLTFLSVYKDVQNRIAQGKR